jgi:hypothetical protein
MARSSLALLTSVSLVALACGGEPQRSGGAGITTQERAESPSAEESESDWRWPGPWTACPQAEWVRQVAERAGYRVTGETGSALVAQGNGWNFYIWATEMTTQEEGRNTIKREKWRSLGAVKGIEVYGDQTLWRWWIAHGYVLWLGAGPYRDSEIPPLAQLGSLVRASKILPPPR